MIVQPFLYLLQRFNFFIINRKFSYKNVHISRRENHWRIIIPGYYILIFEEIRERNTSVQENMNHEVEGFQVIDNVYTSIRSLIIVPRCLNKSVMRFANMSVSDIPW